MRDVSTNNNLVSPEDARDLTGWRADIFAEFYDRMTDTHHNFPCVFGVESIARGSLRYGFVDSVADLQAGQLEQILHKFTATCEKLGTRTSLVCFFETWEAEKTHTAYWIRFWELLREVSRADDTAWPEGISKKLDDPSFEFTFLGQPMFVVVSTPLHRRRQSRYSSRVAITFQPRFVFDDIAEGTVRGDAARTLIRRRLIDYDTVPVSATLGNFGDPSNREWSQYYIDDGDRGHVPWQCPFSTL